MVFYGRDALGGLVFTQVNQGMNLQRVTLQQVAAPFVGALTTCRTHCVLLNFDTELTQKHATLLSRNDLRELMQKKIKYSEFTP